MDVSTALAARVKDREIIRERERVRKKTA